VLLLAIMMFRKPAITGSDEISFGGPAAAEAESESTISANHTISDDRTISDKNTIAENNTIVVNHHDTPDGNAS
jgi:hypothetical protein